MTIYAIKHLTAEEDLRTEPYQDSLGYWTIGVGHLIDRRRGGTFPEWIKSFPLTKDEAEKLLSEDIDKVEEELIDRIPWYLDLDQVRQTVLLSMAFQMGVGGLLTFKRTLAHISKKEYALAAAEMFNSKWASQTKKRAGRLALAMRSGHQQWLDGP